MTDTTEQNNEDGLLVYIAGPYQKGSWGGNINRAVEAAEAVYNHGHYPFIPHTMTGLWSVLHQKEKQQWLDFYKRWLKQCDCMIRLDGYSEGSDFEESVAKDNGIPVFYSIGQFIDQFEDIARDSHSEVDVGDVIETPYGMMEVVDIEMEAVGNLSRFRLS